MKSNIYIPLYVTLNSHPKFLKLCVLLNKTASDERLLLRAKLENLWLWTMQYFPLGILQSCSAQEIALACSWSDNPDEWIDALIECDFLEQIENGFAIVNWEWHGGKQSIKRHTDSLRKHRSRHLDSHSELHQTEPVKIHPIDAINNSDCSQNLLNSPQSIDRVHRVSAGCHTDTTEIPSKRHHLQITIQSNNLYNLYPRPGAKAASLKAIRQALERAPYETLHKALLEFIDDNKRLAKNTSIPLAAEWFNRQCSTEYPDDVLARLKKPNGTEVPNG